MYSVVFSIGMYSRAMNSLKLTFSLRQSLLWKSIHPKRKFGGKLCRLGWVCQGDSPAFLAKSSICLTGFHVKIFLYSHQFPDSFSLNDPSIFAKDFLPAYLKANRNVSLFEIAKVSAIRVSEDVLTRVFGIFPHPRSSPNLGKSRRVASLFITHFRGQ